MLANELKKCESSQFTIDVAAEELQGNSFQHWLNVTTEASETVEPKWRGARYV